MTQSMYAAKITEIIDAQHPDGYVYPESFDSDVAACFARRMTPEAAAEKLLADWQS
jgi:hypothetical protein